MPIYVLELTVKHVPFRSFTCKVVGFSILNLPLICSPSLHHELVVAHKKDEKNKMKSFFVDIIELYLNNNRHRRIVTSQILPRDRHRLHRLHRCYPVFLDEAEYPSHSDL